VISDDVAGVVLPFAVPCETFVLDQASLSIDSNDPAARETDPPFLKRRRVTRLASRSLMRFLQIKVLDALGADVSRIHHLAVLRSGETERAVQLADTAELELAIRERGARLVILDPIPIRIATRKYAAAWRP
jgi:hypothetical protein